MSERIHIEIKGLFETPTLPALGPEVRPGVLSPKQLADRLTSLCAAAKLNSNQQQLILALLLLWHDHLDASHEISQGISTADGSFVHAIMHRREPDYWNSNYWWQRVGAHAAYIALSTAVTELLQARKAGVLAKKLLPGGRWDPGAFVDLCENAASSPEYVELLQEIQRLEKAALLESLLLLR